MTIAIFVISYLLTTLWLHLWLFFIGRRKKNIFETRKDDWILDLVNRKAGLKISEIKVVDSNNYFAMTAGATLSPTLIISKKILDEFKKEESEYVIIHEIGHFLMGHNLKELLIDIILLLAGSILMISAGINWLLAILAGIFFGIFATQLFRGFEYQADEFYLKTGGQPVAMISATKKLAKGNKSKLVSYGFEGLLKTLFVRSVPYWERVKIAEEFLVSK